MNSETKQFGTNSPLWPIGTLVAWLVCVSVGLLGLGLRYPGPHIPESAEKLPPTQIVTAQLTPQPVPPPESEPPPPTPQASPSSAEPPAPAPTPLNLPAQPAIVAVAPPSPSISFAMPAEGLTRIVDASQASYTRAPMVSTAPAGGGNGTGPPGPAPAPPSPMKAATAPVVSRLTFGEGEGRQPPPDYPRDAVLAHQEGTVTLRFTVGEDGRVASVEVISASRWPLLNQAASRAVRDTWRFNPGPKRIYEVPIEFELNH